MAEMNLINYEVVEKILTLESVGVDYYEIGQRVGLSRTRVQRLAVLYRRLNVLAYTNSLVRALMNSRAPRVANIVKALRITRRSGPDAHEVAMSGPAGLKTTRKLTRSELLEIALALRKIDLIQDVDAWMSGQEHQNISLTVRYAEPGVNGALHHDREFWRHRLDEHCPRCGGQQVFGRTEYGVAPMSGDRLCIDCDHAYRLSGVAQIPSSVFNPHRQRINQLREARNGSGISARCAQAQ